METPAPTSAPADEATNANAKPRLGWTRWLLVLPSVIVATAVVYELRSSREEKAVWLNASDLVHAGYAGPLRQLKSKAEGLPVISSLVQRYRDSQPRIAIVTMVFSLAPTAAQEVSFGTPIATNADGARAWILTPGGQAAFRKEIGKINRDVFQGLSPGRPSLMVLNGNQGSVSMGNSIVAGTNSLFAGLVVAVRAKVVSSEIKLSASVTDTEEVTSQPGRLPTLKTNLAAACRARVPIGGALVIDDGKVNPKNGMSQWILLNVSAMDSKGRPISGSH